MRDLHILLFVLLTLGLSFSVNFMVSGQNIDNEWNSFGSLSKYIDSAKTVTVTIFDRDSNRKVHSDYSVNFMKFNNDSRPLINDIRTLCDTLANIKRPEMYILNVLTYDSINYIVIQDWGFDISETWISDIIGALVHNDKIFYIKAADSTYATDTLIKSLFIKECDSINIQFQLKVISNYFLFLDDTVTRVECRVNSDSLQILKYLREGRLLK